MLKAARGLYDSFWMYVGFLYIGAVGLVYSTLCSALHLVLRGAAPAHAAGYVDVADDWGTRPVHAAPVPPVWPRLFSSAPTSPPAPGSSPG